MRVIWAGLGLLSVALGLLGAVLPLLPTTPFLLLAAMCFARSSPALHAWLVGHPRLGPPIRDWQAHGAISRPAKRMAVVAILLAFGMSIAMGLRWEVLALQGAVLSLVLSFILTRPEGPR
jgi:uncharacterized protein